MSRNAVLVTSVSGTIIILIVSFLLIPLLRNNPGYFLAYTGIAFGSVLFMYSFGEKRPRYLAVSSQLIFQSIIFILGRSLLFESSFSLNLLGLPLTASGTLFLLYYENREKKIFLYTAVGLVLLYLLMVALGGHFSLRAVMNGIREIDNSFLKLVVAASFLGIFWYVIAEQQKDVEYEETDEVDEDNTDSEALREQNNDEKNESESISPGSSPSKLVQSETSQNGSVPADTNIDRVAEAEHPTEGEKLPQASAQSPLTPKITKEQEDNSLFPKNEKDIKKGEAQQ